MEVKKQQCWCKVYIWIMHAGDSPRSIYWTRQYYVMSWNKFHTYQNTVMNFDFFVDIGNRLMCLKRDQTESKVSGKPALGELIFSIKISPISGRVWNAFKFPQIWNGLLQLDYFTVYFSTFFLNHNDPWNFCEYMQISVISQWLSFMYMQICRTCTYIFTLITTRR